MAGVGRWARPLGIVLTVLVLVPTIVTGVVMGQYAPIVVAVVVCALAWLLAGLLWRRFADLVVWLKHGSRP